MKHTHTHRGPTHKQGEQQRKREKQSPHWAGSLMWGSILEPWAEGRALTDWATQVPLNFSLILIAKGRDLKWSLWPGFLASLGVIGSWRRSVTGPVCGVRQCPLWFLMCMNKVHLFRAEAVSDCVFQEGKKMSGLFCLSYRKGKWKRQAEIRPLATSSHFSHPQDTPTRPNPPMTLWLCSHRWAVLSVQMKCNCCSNLSMLWGSSGFIKICLIDTWA